LIQLIMPAISFLGHLGGLLAGYLCLWRPVSWVHAPSLHSLTHTLCAPQISLDWSPSWSPPRTPSPNGITGAMWLSLLLCLLVSSCVCCLPTRAAPACAGCTIDPSTSRPPRWRMWWTTPSSEGPCSPSPP